MENEAGAPQGQGDKTDELARLRRLLLSPERERLEALERQVGSFEEPGPESISRVLPEALLHGLKNDERLSGALAPTIEEAVQESVKRDPKPLADAIFPIIGPAIRKSITEAIGGMLQSFQQTMEHSLSIQGLKWRIEALRTGRPYAEVVLLQTLVFQVEQVFLIHRETGLLLQHVSAEVVDEMEADMVSSMLTAIRDFVQDSFGGQGEDSLQTMRVGERSVVVEQGPHAILAGVVRGTAPAHLGVLFQETLEQIHLTQKEALGLFEGDSDAFLVSKPLLEKCLAAQYREERKPRRALSMALRLVFVAGIAAFCLWLGHRFWEEAKFSSYVARLEAEPGIVVTDSGRDGGILYVSGLRDPLAALPGDLLVGTVFDSTSVRGQWEAYQSFHPPLVVKRARRLLQPPPQIELSLVDGVLSARGTAPMAWIKEAAMLARALPGISAYDATGVEAVEFQHLEQVRSRLEDTVVYFSLGTVTPVAGESAKLEGLVGDIQVLAVAAEAVGQRLGLEIAGHTDGSGTEDTNRLLSQKRAEWVRQFLVDRGIAASRLTFVGKGPTELARSEISEEDRVLNRRITLKVVPLSPEH
jgi:hypothetical protein